MGIPRTEPPTKTTWNSWGPIAALAIVLVSCGAPRRRDGALPPDVETAYLRGDWNTAIRLLEPQMSLPDDRVHAGQLELLGRCYLGADRPVDALAAFRKARRASQDAVVSARCHEGMARAHYALGDWVRSVGELDRMYEGPTHAVDRAVAEDRTVLLFAVVCARAGRWDDAVRAYERAARLLTGSAERTVMLRLAVVRLRSCRVQFGAFESVDDATDLQIQLDAMRIPTEILSVRSLPDPVYLVLSPAVDTYDAALRMQAQYRALDLDALAIP